MTKRRQRWLRCAMACLYLVGYLLTFSHFVEERHAVCHEHGAQHHIAESTEIALFTGDDVPRLHEGAVVEDDHCSLLQFFRSNTFTVTRPGASLEPCASADELEPTDFRATSRTRADNRRWSFAPKQSPPISA